MKVRYAHQLRELDSRLAALRKAATAAEQSFRQGDLDLAGYVNLQSNFLKAQEDFIRLRATLQQAQSALRMLLGLPFDAGTTAEAQR